MALTWGSLARELDHYRRLFDDAWSDLADALPEGCEAHDALVGRHLLVTGAAWGQLVDASPSTAAQAALGGGLALLGWPVYVTECPCTRHRAAMAAINQGGA